RDRRVRGPHAVELMREPSDHSSVTTRHDRRGRNFAPSQAPTKQPDRGMDQRADCASTLNPCAHRGSRPVPECCWWRDGWTVERVELRTGVVTEESVERNRQSGEERKTEVAAR